MGLPLQLLLLVNLQPGAPAALGLLRHFGAHDLPALFGERGGCRVAAGLGVELPARGRGTRRLRRRRRRRSEPLQGRAARLACAPGPLRGDPGGGAVGGARSRRAAAVPGVERDVEGPRTRGPAQGQGARCQAGARVHHVGDPPHPAVRRRREQSCPEQKPPPEPGPRHRGPQPARPAARGPAPSPGRAARLSPRVWAPPRAAESSGKAGGGSAGSGAAPDPGRLWRGAGGGRGGGERGARGAGRGEGSGQCKVRVRAPDRGCSARRGGARRGWPRASESARDTPRQPRRRSLLKVSLRWPQVSDLSSQSPADVTSGGRS